MEEITFLVKGAAERYYIVTFRKSDKNFSAQCNCPDSLNGKFCQHKLRILNGISTDIVSNNISDIKIVQDWLSGSDIEKAINELKEAEREYEIAKKIVSIYKKKLA